MKFLKNKIVVAALCFAVAIVIAFVLVPSSNKHGETTNVIKVSSTITENTKITEKMLKEVAVSSDSVPDGAITDKNDVVGKYARVALYPSDYIINDKLSTIDTESNLYSLQSGEMAISVTPKTLAKSVSGNLLIGDVVQIYAYDTQAKTLNEDSGRWYFEVLAIDNSKSENVSGVDLENASDIVPAAITVKAISPEQVKSIVEMEMNNDIQVVFAGRGETAATLLGKAVN
jgi:Flp pilus assembly protein CpaB